MRRLLLSASLGFALVSGACGDGVQSRRTAREAAPRVDDPRSGGRSEGPNDGIGETPSHSASANSTPKGTQPPKSPLSGREPSPRWIVTLQNGVRIDAGSYVIWTKGRESISAYTPRNYPQRSLELSVEAKSGNRGSEEFLRPTLTDISRITFDPATAKVFPEGAYVSSTIHLHDGRTISGTLRGKHWEGKTTLEGLEATRTVALAETAEVTLRPREGHPFGCDGTIRDRSGGEFQLREVEFQLLSMAPFLGVRGNTGINLQAEPAVSVLVPEAETSRIDIVGRHESEGRTGIDVRLFRRDGSEIAAPTFDGLEVRGVYQIGDFQGLQTDVRFDNADLLFVKSIEREE
ncbi:MAG: hypothetical protein WED34_12115 [Planctomycetales bacterium]